MNQFTKKPPKPSLRQWQPQPAPVLPLQPDPAQPAVTWYQNYSGQVYPGYGTPYDIVAANIENINTVADNIDAINTVVSGEYLPVDGSAPMTGPLILARNPLAPMEAVTLTYLEQEYLPLTGGQLSGELQLAGPPQNFSDAATKGYVDQYAGVGYTGTWQVAANSPDISGGGTQNGQFYMAITLNPSTPEIAPASIPGIGGQTIANNDRIVWNEASAIWQRIQASADFPIYDTRYVQLAGSTMTGPLILYGDPQSSLEPVTYEYFDMHMFTQAQGDMRWLQLTGGTLSGPLTMGAGATLTLAADPVSNMQAATKEYVDNNAGAVVISDTAPASPRIGSLWFDSVGCQTYIWENDGNSSQWLPVNAPPSSAAQYLALSGGTLTGPLILSHDGAQPLEAATYEQVAAAYNDVGRNKIHNPLMNIAQRGAGNWSAVGYTLDRWVLSFTGTAAVCQQSVMTDAYRASIGDEAARFALRTTVTGSATAGDYTIHIQNIEGVRRLSGKTVTVSFWAMAETSGQRIGASLSQYFGSGGSPSASVNVNGQSVALPAALGWTRYNATFTLPSTAGKTLGTNGDDYTSLIIWYTAGSTYAAQSGNVGMQSSTFNLWGVQLEIGTQATALEKPDPRYDLANCQRFFCVTNCWFYAYNNAGVAFGYTQTLPVTMRALPSIVLSGQSYTNAASLTAAASPGTVILYAVPSANGPAQFSGTVTASADL